MSDPRQTLVTMSRTLQELLAELRVADASDVDLAKPTSSSSASLKVAQESAYRALAARNRGQMVAGSQVVEMDVDADEAVLLFKAGATYDGPDDPRFQRKG